MVIADASEPRDNTNRQIGEKAVVPKGFTRIDVGEMDLYKWNRNTRKRITKRHTRMRETCRINNNRLRFRSRCMDFINQRRF